MTAPAHTKTDTLLRVENLTVAFGADQVVQDASFTVGSGEIVGIVGESGSGKSITCRSILGLLPRGASSSGRVLFDGRALSTLAPEAMRAVRGRQISMIFQNPASHLDPLMTVGRHVAEPLRLHLGYGAAAARSEAVRMLGDVQLHNPEQRIHAYPHELSGGMKQRVMIASAIACAPRLLLADEPTTALDVTVQARILDLLLQLNRERGLSIILVSHDLGVIAEICDRVVVMRDGRVVESGPTERLINAPQHAYTQLLISSQPRNLQRKSASTPAADAAAAAPLLAVRDLSVTFGTRSRNPLQRLLRRHGTARQVHAVQQVGFTVMPGETLGIVGESGSGKSTIAQTIVRLIQPTSGSIAYQGRAVTDLAGGELAAYRRAVQMVFQNPFDSLNPRMTVAQAVTEPLLRHRLASGQQARARMRQLLELVELPEALADRRPTQLSGGQCQRVGIARALALRPQLLIADEITSALDVTIQAQILTLLQELQQSQNLTLIYISHDLSVVRAFCDRVAVFQAGQLVEIGAADEVLYRPQQAYTRTLLDSIPRLAGIAATEGA